jgi:DNA-binding transcriptional regulator GbsR (MarR family)
MNLKVKNRMDLVQYAVDVMSRTAEEIRGLAAVGGVQVLLRLSETPVTPKELAEALKEDEEDIADSLEIFEEFGIVDIVDPDGPSYTYLGYPEEIKFLITNRPTVKQKFEDAVKAIENVLSREMPAAEEENRDCAILLEMVHQMKKDYDIE